MNNSSLGSMRLTSLSDSSKLIAVTVVASTPGLTFSKSIRPYSSVCSNASLGKPYFISPRSYVDLNYLCLPLTFLPSLLISFFFRLLGDSGHSSFFHLLRADLFSLLSCTDYIAVNTGHYSCS